MTLVTERHKAGSAIADVLRQASGRLAAAGCESPRVDAEILLGHALGVDRAALYADSRRRLKDAESEALESLLARRERREPLAYVLGEWGFRGLTLSVDPRVLVPRPETEIVVERALLALAGLAEPRALDVGTGSGAIALAIADEHRGARVTALDSSAAALEVARVNAERTGHTIELVHADFFAGLPAGPWDLVVSNPPYVLPDEIEALEPEVREWEPREALIALGATEAVAKGTFEVLTPGGKLVLEVADGDAVPVATLLADLGYRDVVTTRDLSGRERVLEASRP